MRRNKRQLKKQMKASDKQTQFIIQNIQNTQGYCTEFSIPDIMFISEAYPRKPNERWEADPNPDLPTKRKMTLNVVE